MNRNLRRRRLAALALAAGLVVLALGCAACVSHRPRAVGLVGGHLAPCPDSPNCVSSETDKPAAAVAALAFEDDPDTAWARAVDAVEASGGRIRERDNVAGYLWATYTSLIFRFTDDLELRLDAPAAVIHVRSASRVGYSDLGANRRRVERLRAAFAPHDSP